MGSMTPFLGLLSAVLGPIGVSKILDSARAVAVTFTTGRDSRCSCFIGPEHNGRCDGHPSYRCIPCH